MHILFHALVGWLVATTKEGNLQAISKDPEKLGTIINEDVQCHLVSNRASYSARLRAVQTWKLVRLIMGLGGGGSGYHGRRQVGRRARRIPAMFGGGFQPPPPTPPSL